MFRFVKWINDRRISGSLGLTLAACSGAASAQTPLSPQPPQQDVSAARQAIGTLALPPIAEPQRVTPGDARPVATSLFEQERDSFDQVAERRIPSPNALPSLRGGVTTTPVNPQTINEADLLRRAGVVINTDPAGRFVVERVLPNSAGLTAGLRTGDVIARIYPAPAPVAVVGQPAPVGPATVPLDIVRKGELTRITLVATEPILRSTVVTGPVAPDRVIVNSQLGATRDAQERTLRDTGPVVAPGSGSPNGTGVAGAGGRPQGPGTPGLGTAPAEGGGSAAMRTGSNAPVKPGQGLGTGRLY